MEHMETMVFHGVPKRGQTFDGRRLVHCILQGEPRLMKADPSLPDRYAVKVQRAKVAFSDGTTALAELYL